MIVMKFGGSSVESAGAIERVAAIVRQNIDRTPVVVVSAMGKTTDRLQSIANFAAAGNIAAAELELEKLRQFHLREGACAREAVEALFAELRDVLTSSGPGFNDAVLSFGERLSSVIVTAAFRRTGLDAVQLDSRSVIVTGNQFGHAELRSVETNALLRRKILRERITVMGGFIGATEDGIPTTLGRGGSDYTAAIVGAALSVDEIQIWTDVDGMLTCDPRVFPNVHCIRTISFAEAETMANAGAKVLHPATVAPAMRQRVPIVIRNSRNPQAVGTTIVRENPCDGLVMSIAFQTGLTVLRLTPRNTPMTSDFSDAVWGTFKAAGVDCELIAMLRTDLSVTVPTNALTPEFLGRLRAIAAMEMHEAQAKVTLIGHNAARNATNFSRATHALSRMRGTALPVCCADSRIAFLIPESTLAHAAEKLHAEFFAEPNPAYFVANRAALTLTVTRSGSSHQAAFANT